MKNRLSIALSVLFSGAIMISSGNAWASPADPQLVDGDESKTTSVILPPPAKESQTWNVPRGIGWEKRFFNTPLLFDNSSKDDKHSSTLSGIPLKAPGMLPGISFDIEMHSFQAFQSVIPPERWSKSFNSSPNQPLLVSPSNISPDYNGGFLRFSW